MRYGFNSGRQYWIWVKGRKEETAERMEAQSKMSAMIKFATRRNMKTTQCDGVWLKPGSKAAHGYIAARGYQWPIMSHD